MTGLDASWADAWSMPPGLEEQTFMADAQGRPAWLLVWSDEASARAALDELDVVSEGGSVEVFELPVTMEDDEEPGATEPVLAIVRVPSPWYATRRAIVSRFEKLVPEYRAAEGLIRKDFLLTDDDELGGVYRWTDPESADEFYDDAWERRIRERYGVSIDDALEIWTVVDADWVVLAP